MNIFSLFKCSILKIFHVLVIHSCYRDFALHIGIVVDEVADSLAQELIAYHGTNSGCTKTYFCGFVVNAYAGYFKTLA